MPLSRDRRCDGEQVYRRLVALVTEAVRQLRAEIQRLASDQHVGLAGALDDDLPLKYELPRV
jgi:hypothetical protein